MENPFNQPPFDISDYFPSFTQEEKEAIHRYIMPFLSENNNANKNNASKNDNTNRNDSTNKIDRRIKKDKKNRSEQTKFISIIRKYLTEREARPFFAYLLNLPLPTRAEAIQLILRPFKIKRKYLRFFFEQPCNATFDKLLEKGLDEQQKAGAEERLRMARQILRSTRATSEIKPKSFLFEEDDEDEQLFIKDAEEQHPSKEDDPESTAQIKMYRNLISHSQAASDYFTEIITEHFKPKKKRNQTESVYTKLLEERIKQGNKRYRVDRDELMKRLKKEAQEKMEEVTKPEMTRWWRAVYEWMTDKGIIKLPQTSKKPRPKYKKFAECVVCFCLPDEDASKVSERIAKASAWHGFFDELDELMKGVITEL